MRSCWSVLGCLEFFVLGCLEVLGFFGVVKRVRLHRKTPAHLTGYVGNGSLQSRPRVWKRLMAEDAGFRLAAAKAPRLHLGDEAHGPRDKVGVG